MNSLYQKRAGQPVQASQPMDVQEVDALRYDYDQIEDPVARQTAQGAASQIKPILRRTAVNAWTVGNLANTVKAQLKEQLGHGQFLAWAEAEFDPDDPSYTGVRLSVRSLQRWMGLAERVALADVQGSGMSLAGLLEVSTPSTPDDVRTKVLEHAAAGEPLTKADVVKLKQAASVGRGGGGGGRVTVGVGKGDRPTAPGAGETGWAGLGKAKAGEAAQATGDVDHDIIYSLIRVWLDDYLPPAQRTPAMQVKVLQNAAANYYSGDGFHLRNFLVRKGVPAHQHDDAIAFEVKIYETIAARLSNQPAAPTTGQSRRDWGIVATDWLAEYVGKNGETWGHLTETQIHHANSPCHQSFVKQFPDCPDPKTALRQAHLVLTGQVVTTPAEAGELVSVTLADHLWHNLIKHLKGRRPLKNDEYDTILAQLNQAVGG